MLQKLLEAPRATKRFISLAHDSLALSLSLYASWALREGTPFLAAAPIDFICLGLTLLVSLFVFVKLGLYRAVLRYMTTDAVLTVLLGILISAMTLAATNFFLNGNLPRSVPVIYLLTASFLVGLPRLITRNVIQALFPMGDTKVLIYGAGRAGRMLADSLRQSKDFQPVAFLDDDPKLENSRIRGLPVHSGREAQRIVREYKCSKIFLALGAVDRATRLKIVRDLEHFSVQIQTIPPLEELTKGQASIEELRDVQIEDLLGRDPVKPDAKLMRHDIYNKVVMVTGAGGSIGAELCRQIISQQPRALILFELNEYNLYIIEDELKDQLAHSDQAIEIISMLGSVQDGDLLKVIFKEFKVDTIYHAAAYKHVPLVEYNLVEGLRNNVIGTLTCARAASESGASTFVLVSTDKAVRSTNIMGASKRIAELTIKALSQSETNQTKFCIVRFGNVLGSSGSVVPKFKRQIANGGPVTITHPEVARYFMTIPEAAQLVIQAGALASSGETYVLEMGEPVKIADLAREMIILSGYTVQDKNNPDGDIPIAYTGLRSGEKLHEELLFTENVVGTKHPRITEALEPNCDPAQIYQLVEQLTDACSQFDFEQVFALLRNTPTVYEGGETINDSVFCRRRQLSNRELSLVKS